MKKIALFIVAICLSLGLMAQTTGPVSLAAITVDTIETVSTSTIQVTTYPIDLVIQATCTELGGDADGYVYLDASVDGSTWVNLTTTANLVDVFGNDTLTIDDAATNVWVVRDAPFEFYRVRALGTASDTTSIAVKYNFKRK